MPTVYDALQAIESLAPTSLAYSSDKIGLQVGDPGAEFSKALVSLDRSHAAIRRARGTGAQLLVCHHPLIWNPLSSVRSDTYEGQAVGLCIQGGVSVIAAHTNWDAALGGINDVLAERLGLVEVQPFGSASDRATYKLVTYVPENASKALAESLWGAGAGVIDQYERCSFKVLGEGTFKGREGLTDPHVGKAGRLETSAEVRLEMICSEDALPRAERALVEAHPYETPAYEILRCVAHGGSGPIGRLGTLPRRMTTLEFVRHAESALETRVEAWGDPEKKIERVAVVGGAAAGEWQAAAGLTDAFLTGEVPQHLALEASEQGLTMLAAGHYATEHPGCVRLCERLREVLPAAQWEVFEPSPGSAGRPLRRSGSPDGT